MSEQKKNMREKTWLAFTWSITVLTLALWMSMHWSIRFTNLDDMHMVFYSQSWEALTNHIRYYVITTGRLSHVLFTSLASVPYLVPKEFFHSVMKASGLLFMFGGYVYFLKELSGSFSLAALSVVIALGLAEINWEFNPIVSYPFVISFQMGCLFASFASFLQSFRTKRSFLRWTSAILYFICCASYEAYIPFILVYPLMALMVKAKGSVNGLRDVLRASRFHILVWSIWLVCYFLFKKVWGESGYSGVSFDISDPRRVLRTYFSYLVSSFPGAPLWGRNETLSEALGHLSVFQTAALHSATHWAFLVSFTLALLVIPVRARIVEVRKFIAIVTVPALLSFVLIAVSLKYQQRVESFSYSTYVPTLTAHLLLSSLCAALLGQATIHRHWLSRWSMHAIALIVLAAVALSVQNHNWIVLKEMHDSSRRWRLIDQLFAQAPAPVLSQAKSLVMPQLRRQLGAAHASREYWSEYLVHTHGIQMLVLFDESEIPTHGFPALVLRGSIESQTFQVYLVDSANVQRLAGHPIKDIVVR